MMTGGVASFIPDLHRSRPGQNVTADEKDLHEEGHVHGLGLLRLVGIHVGGFWQLAGVGKGSLGQSHGDMHPSIQ